MGDTEKLDILITEVVGIKKRLTMLTDRLLTRVELARAWGVTDDTIRNYTKLRNNPLPVLKNGKYPWQSSVDWLYGSPILETLKGQAIIKKIEEVK
jgi:hypothetical protein